ncbi:fibronectin type III domain protein, partial [Winogradskyella wandonensis]
MKRITLTILLALFALVQTVSAQTHKRIKINASSHQEVHRLADLGIDLRCGAIQTSSAFTMDIANADLEILRSNNIPYQVIIHDLNQFYKESSNKDLLKGQLELQREKSKTLSHYQSLSQRSSVALNTLDNYLQYIGANEVDWNVPLNYPDVTSTAEVPMGGSLTVSQVLTELDKMRAYSQNNGLDIVSEKADASGTSNHKTWGNPATTITNPYYSASNSALGPQTYTGVGSAQQRFDPQTIYYVRITGNESSTTEGDKPQILYTSMIHSRELASLMGNIYFMWYLIENYDKDPAIKELVDNNELYFIPVVNPDGLRWNEAIASNGGGMQRKNLRPNTNSSSLDNRGVDLNRNFAYFWGSAGSGSSGSPTSSGYRGPAPFSEPETRIVKNFVESRNFKTTVWQHSFANSIPHPYGGNPSFVSGREDEMQKWHEDMTRYNRFVSGATIFPPANGIADDWMVGGNLDTTNNTIGATANGDNSTLLGVLATTPENGSNSDGFWPSRSNIINIVKRMMRINLMNAYYGGRYAKFHDLTPSNILSGQPPSNLTTDLTFGIERVGQTDGNFTLTITPIQNIQSVASPTIAINGLNVLDQTEVSSQITLTSGIQPNERIIYRIQLANSTGAIFYDATYEKVYQPNLLFQDNPDTDLLSNWTTSGTWTAATVSGAAYSGTRGIKVGGNNNNSYPNSTTRTITTANTYNFNSNPDYLIQYFAKWDIERNYDFVEVLASVNGGAYQPLEGKYTKPAATLATNDHANNSGAPQDSNSLGLIYDGDLFDNWKMEEIVIDSETNAFLLGASNVRIRFRFVSDNDNVLENYSSTPTGFYFDDFRIIGLDVPCDAALEPNNIEVNNIDFTSADVSWSNTNTPLATYDLRYREIGTLTWTEITNINATTQSITGLDTNTEYEVQVATRCNTNLSNFSDSKEFTTLNLCDSTISTFPYSESFETALATFTGDWTQGANGTEDDLDWTNNSGGTVSSGTGPTGASNGSRYLYTEVSAPGNITPVRDAILTSPCFDLTGRQNSTFTFDYHMFGLNTSNPMGSLSIEVSDNGAAFIPIPTGDTSQGNPLSGPQQTSSDISTPQGEWKTQSVNLSAYDGKVIRLRFIAISDGTFTSDISIDNLNFTSDIATSGPTAITQDITVNLDATGNATITEDAVNNGSTGTGTLTFDTDITSFTCANIGANTVTLTVTDDNGSDTATATVTVNDNTAPVPDAASLPDATGECSATITGSAPTATDNCGGTITGTTTDSLTSSTQGTTTVTWTFDDGNGNTSTQTQNIVINDTTAPTITAPANVTVSANASCEATGVILGTPTTADNCGVATVTNDAPATFPLGTTTVTWTVT